MNDAEDLDIVMPMYNLIEYSKTIQQQQEVCRTITEMSQIVVQYI